jgi:hypothetical protein
MISTVYGLWPGVEYARRVGRRGWKGAMSQVRHVIAMYFKFAFPLFILAALIETFLIFSMGGVPLGENGSAQRERETRTESPSCPTRWKTA